MTTFSRKVLCTVGPASWEPKVLRRLEALGVSLFRVNLSHTPVEDIERIVRMLQEHSTVPVCLDSEGAQVRTGMLTAGPMELKEHSQVEVRRAALAGGQSLSLTPDTVFELVRTGDLLTIDFNGVVAQVIEVGEDSATLRILNGGKVGNNKAVTVQRALALPAITPKDHEAIRIGRKLGVKNYALSFANRPEDVREMRALIGPDATLISKIESRSGIEHLESIAQASDAILIDRGDLSREVPLESIPSAQKEIIRRAKAAGRPVYVATNLLESMVATSAPTRAEVNDIFNTLADGADGLVLAAETAVGRFPLACATMVFKMISEFERVEAGAKVSPKKALTPPPAGPRERHWPADPTDEINRLPRLVVSPTDLMDAEQIALGTYWPLTGFMDQETLGSVLREHRLPDGTPWTLPITLQIAAGTEPRFGPGDRVALTATDGVVYAVMDVTDVFQTELTGLAKLWFGTDSSAHPGVARVLGQGSWFLAGAVSLVRRLPSPHAPFLLTPAQLRFLFNQKNWTRVVSFHTRNVLHRAHEHIQLEALRRTEADGLLISPVIGPRKRGDFTTSAVLRSYQACLEAGIYPEGRAVLSGFGSYPRYAGPREAVFTAMCRRNMGCTHFIIGRDHTGVGRFYEPDAAQRLFESLGDVGIEPVFFSKVAYDPKSNAHAESPVADSHDISGTQIREALIKGTPLAEWLVRPCVMESLHAELLAGRPVLVE